MDINYCVFQWRTNKYLLSIFLDFSTPFILWSKVQGPFVHSSENKAGHFDSVSLFQNNFSAVQFSRHWTTTMSQVLGIKSKWVKVSAAE